MSVTSLHLAKGKGAEDKPDTKPTLAQSVYNRGTSKVTKDSEDTSGKEEEDNEADGSSTSKQVDIDGMDILHSNGKHVAALFSTALMEEMSKQASKGEIYMEEDSAGREESDSSDENKWQEEEKEESYLTAKMDMTTAQLHLGSDDEGSNFQENKINICSDDLDLNLQDYASNAQEVLSGEFDAAYVKNYANPKTFLHALWNAAGPSAGAMVTCLDILKDKLAGQLAGVLAELRDLPEQLINFMYEEAGEDPHNAIKFITHVSHQLSQFDDKEEEEDNKSHVKVITYAKDAPVEDALGINHEGTQEGASKTQGSLPGAQQTSPTEGAVTEPATAAGGDKEGVQSMSVVPGG